MARRRSLAGSLAGRLSGALSGRVVSGAAPAPFVGAVDGLTAAGNTVNFAFSTSYQIDTAGAGNYALVRRASDNLTQALPVNTTTHLLDGAAIAAWCGASDGFIETLYDRSGNARDVTNATLAEQPKIYDGATGLVLTGSLPMALLDGGAGTAGTGDGWARADSAGYLGTQAVCTWYWGSFTDVATYHRTALQIGTGSGTSWAFRHLPGKDAGFSNQNGSADGNYRVFTENQALSTPSGFRLQTAAGAVVAAAELYQRGVALVESGVASAAGPNIPNTALTIGSNETQARGVTGRFAVAIGLNALPNAAAITLLDALDATLCGIAGV